MNDIIYNMGGVSGAVIGALCVLGFVGFLTVAALRVGVTFVVRRLASLVFIVLCISFITFTLSLAVPSDTVYAQLGNHYRPVLATQLRHYYGLDLPWYVQYLQYLDGILHFDFGYSWVDSTQSVVSIFARYLPASLELGIWGTVLTLVMGAPLGLLSSVRANSWVDSSIQFVAMLLYILPTFVLIPFFEIAMIALNNQGLPALATSGWGTWDTEIGPILLFAAGSFGYYVRLTRSTMLEELGKDYIRAARAKGLTERVVLWRHAFRNTLIPLVTSLGPALGGLVGGLFIVEGLFNIPGIATEELAAIGSHDVPVIVGTTILLSTAVVFMNVVTDVSYGFVDPRVKSA
ncbi:MAG: ABC transporter permease [Ktedonobacterales bacterium]